MTRARPDLDEAFRVAVETRKFEIDLFWKRSTFFWAFNAAAFAGFVALARERALGLSILVASFGLVCSVGWALVNLGSKLWYENWELHVGELEDGVTGPLFGKTLRKPTGDDHWSVRARRFSVSKITILISYYVVAMWGAVLSFQTLDVFLGDHARGTILRWCEPILPVATLIFVGLMFRLGRGGSSDTDKSRTQTPKGPSGS